MEKKHWSEPRLLELVRGAPEEAVLLACRTTQPGTSAPVTTGIGCYCMNHACTNCEVLTPS